MPGWPFSPGGPPKSSVVHKPMGNRREKALQRRGGIPARRRGNETRVVLLFLPAPVSTCTRHLSIYLSICLSIYTYLSMNPCTYLYISYNNLHLYAHLRRAGLPCRAGRAGRQRRARRSGRDARPSPPVPTTKQTNKQTNKRLGGRRCLSRCLLRCAAPRSPMAGFRCGTP